MKTSFCQYALIVLWVLCGGGVALGQASSRIDEPAAVVDGVVITQQQVDASAGAALFAAQEKVYSLRKAALDGLIMEAVLANAAKKQNLDLDDFKRTLIPVRVEVTQQEVDATYQEAREAVGSMSEDEAKQRIRLDLESRLKIDQYKRSVAAILAKAAIDTRLRAPMPPASLVRAAGPVLGERDAPVTLVEYSDFECPYCRAAAADLKKLLADYGKDVALVYKHMPLPNHPNAFIAARASVCAGEQNKFWEYHDRLFTSDNLGAESLKQHATELGLQRAKFDACMAGSGSAATVRGDMSDAMRAGVKGTPAFFVNGRPIPNTTGFTEIRKAIAVALSEKQGGGVGPATAAHGER